MARRLILLALCAAGCGASSPAPDEPALPSSDPARLADALAAWERGSAALASGDVATARRELTAALDARPDDGLLVLWLCRAERAAGDPSAAYARLDAWLARDPEDGVAAWLRASWRSQDGRLAEAAVDLRTAIASGALTPRLAVAEPELAALAGQPGLPPLPARVVDVVSTSREVDGAVEVGWVVEHPPGAAARWRVEVSVGAKVTAIEQSSVRRPDGDVATTLTARVVGAGPVSLGPGVVELDVPTALRADLPRVGPATGATVPLGWALPSEVLGARATPSAWAVEGGVWIALPPGVSAGTEPKVAPALHARLQKVGEVPVDLVYVPGRADRVSFRADGGVEWVVEVR